MPAPSDRDLLFGVVALQMNFVDQAQLVDVMTSLPGRPGKDAQDLFAERGYLDPSRVQLLLSFMGRDTRGSRRRRPRVHRGVRGHPTSRAPCCSSVRIAGRDPLFASSRQQSGARAPPTRATQAGGDERTDTQMAQVAKPIVLGDACKRATRGARTSTRLGAVLFEILTGKPPYAGLNRYHVVAQVVAPVPPPETGPSREGARARRPGRGVPQNQSDGEEDARPVRVGHGAPGRPDVGHRGREGAAATPCRG